MAHSDISGRPSRSNNVRLLVVALCTVAISSGCGPRYDEVANLTSHGKAIVCFGDSITRGYGAEQGRDYPSELSRLLGQPVVNAGEDGDTTSIALKRIKKSVLDRNPRLVIVELTGNDFLNRIPKKETVANLDQIVKACGDAGAMVVLVHAKFGLWSDPYIDSFKTISKSRSAMLVKNVLGGILTSSRLRSDTIHPNGDGYALIAERVADVVKPLLEESDKRLAQAKSERQ